jgi:hypothetical protein
MKFALIASTLTALAGVALAAPALASDSLKSTNPPPSKEDFDRQFEYTKKDIEGRSGDIQDGVRV